MLEQGQKDVLNYENMEGGHGGAAERAAAGTAPCVLLECVWWAVISGVSRRIYTKLASSPREIKIVRY